jgi:16S rRNA C967 or C1407 C5-methylase (RsmB/RsmF family)/NOL1/NOP2/fmu family ribosome biogenesis protein
MKAFQNASLELPAAFLDRMAGLLGDQYGAFLSSLRQPAVTGLRVNGLKIPASEFIARSPWDLTPVPWCRSGFVVDTPAGNDLPVPPGKHPWHAAGLYYLQEPSAMAAAEILAPLPGERVLDLAAAPGGKATHLASLMHDAGLLLVNELHPDRYWDLAENLQRCGVTNSVGTFATPEKLVDFFGDYFDRVLLDAPCSGEGMFRKGDTARREWNPGLVRGCAHRQSAILEQAARLVRAGGRLVYSTCTFSPEEDEGVIAKFLANHPGFELAVIQITYGMSPARPDWVGLSADHSLKRAIRIWPHQAPGEGHFIALLNQIDSSIQSKLKYRLRKKPIVNKYPLTTPDIPTLQAFHDFSHQALDLDLDLFRLAQAGSFLYYLPQFAPDISGVPALHFGWLLGVNQKGRFRPSHHLAMGLKSDQAFYSLKLSQDDPRLQAYFAGETIPDTGEDAWVLMCVDDFPVGWARRVHQVLKNFYPHGLRRSR